MKVVARRKLASTSKEAPESHQSSFVFTRQTLNSLLLDLYSAHGTYGYEEQPRVEAVPERHNGVELSTIILSLGSWPIFYLLLQMHTRIPTDRYKRSQR